MGSDRKVDQVGENEEFSETDAEMNLSAAGEGTVLRPTNTDAASDLEITDGTTDNQPEAAKASEAAYAAAKESILSGENNTADLIRKRCDPNLNKMFDHLDRPVSISLINHSLLNAEKVGGPGLLTDLLDGVNSDRWLAGNQERIRQNATGHPQERQFDIYNNSTKENIASLHYSLLPEQRVMQEEQLARQHQENQRRLEEQRRIQEGRIPRRIV